MQSILAKSMKDSVVRGRMLQLLYERRREGSIPFGHGEQAVPPPEGIIAVTGFAPWPSFQSIASSTGLLLKIGAEWACCPALLR